MSKSALSCPVCGFWPMSANHYCIATISPQPEAASKALTRTNCVVTYCGSCSHPLHHGPCGAGEGTTPGACSCNVPYPQGGYVSTPEDIAEDRYMARLCFSGHDAEIATMRAALAERGKDLVDAADSLFKAVARADAAEEKLKKAEAFEVAYNSISGNGWLQRAHALPGRLGSDVWHNAVERAERFGAAEARVKTLEKVLREIMGLLDSGYLVRDISHDHENGWAMKQIAPVMILKEAAAALKEKP